MKEMIQKGIVRAYLGYKRVLSNMKGSPTMEYIIIIAAGFAFAMLLYNVFTDKKEGVSEKISEFINKKINEATK